MYEKLSDAQESLLSSIIKSRNFETAPHSWSYKHIPYWGMKCGTDKWWRTQVGVTHLTNSNEQSKKKIYHS